jgi:hypothetical protein
MEESFWDSVAYDFSTEPRYIQDCANWWLDVVMPEPNPIKRAEARAAWRRLWTFDVQKEASYWIKLMNPERVGDWL